ARVVAVTKRLSLQLARGHQELAGGCQKHGEALKVFCQQDETLLCPVCRESRAHRAHTALPLQEAAQHYKAQLQPQLQALQQQQEQLLELRAAELSRSL
ncbi:TRI41 ligase, partial [Eubucco bourcierii]|nr:TRI41 ligase [Eubucco bourcierii]